MYTYNDIAIPISWPDQTARGDEGWMALLKRMGIVKNLNFKVGHAAVLLIESKSGKIVYYDFGRYLVPRGYGRTRSAGFDPRLYIDVTAKLSGNEIDNLEEIMEELFQKETATHGGGRLLFSICIGVSFSKGVAFADQLVKAGPILYGALANGNNSCSRFVAQTITQAMPTNDPRIRGILYPECLKASPTSNVVNACFENRVYCYHEHQLTAEKMSRRQSLSFQIDLLKCNFSTSKSRQLGSDEKAGLVEEPLKNEQVPAAAQWLGGIGEGAWFHIEKMQDNEEIYFISKFDHKGREEYKIPATTDDSFDINKPFTFTYQFLYDEYILIQENKKCTLTLVYQYATNHLQKTTEQLTY